MRVLSMHSHRYGEAGGGSVRACQLSDLLVDQPLSALPPLLGRNWQGLRT